MKETNELADVFEADTAGRPNNCVRDHGAGGVLGEDSSDSVDFLCASARG